MVIRHLADLLQQGYQKARIVSHDNVRQLAIASILLKALVAMAKTKVKGTLAHSSIMSVTDLYAWARGFGLFYLNSSFVRS